MLSLLLAAAILVVTPAEAKSLKKTALENTEVRIQPDSEGNCPNGILFEPIDDCNDCWCTESGSTACTNLYYCHFRRNPCPQGTVYGECGQCRCDPETGRSLCLLIGCPEKAMLPLPEERLMKKISAKQAVDLCPHGVDYSPDDCNGCRCDPASGITACTQMLCFRWPDISPEDKQASFTKRIMKQSEDACSRGEKIFAFDLSGLIEELGDCIQCFCEVDTRRTVCTPAYCALQAERESTSEPSLKQAEVAGATDRCPRGLSFKNDCNTCFCIPETGAVGCTLMGCAGFHPQLAKRSFEKAALTVAKQWKPKIFV